MCESQFIEGYVRSYNLLLKTLEIVHVSPHVQENRYEAVHIAQSIVLSWNRLNIGPSRTKIFEISEGVNNLRVRLRLCVSGKKNARALMIELHRCGISFTTIAGHAEIEVILDTSRQQYPITGRVRTRPNLGQ